MIVRQEQSIFKVPWARVTFENGGANLSVENENRLNVLLDQLDDAVAEVLEQRFGLVLAVVVVVSGEGQHLVQEDRRVDGHDGSWKVETCRN